MPMLAWLNEGPRDVVVLRYLMFGLVALMAVILAVAWVLT